MITSYSYNGLRSDSWEFEKTTLDRINLLVGASGSGKTKFLNTIFNFALFVSRGEPFISGTWSLSICAEGYEYQWEFSCEQKLDSVLDNGSVILSERVQRRKANSNGEFELLVNRNQDSFDFCGKQLPKLQIDKPSVTLLKEEDAIRPLYDTFAKMQRRNFHDEGLRDALAIQNIPSHLVKEMKKSDAINKLWHQEHALSAKLLLLQAVAPKLYDAAIDTYKTVFPSLVDFRFLQATAPQVQGLFQNGATTPIFQVKEKDVNKWIALHEMSSGMQKVLLIITDVLALPADSVYIIDEYENSLGINAIDFLPSFLRDIEQNVQFFVTTHHPYLINNMPMRSWRVFRRQGSKVSIRSGEEFEQKYGKSKQQAFTQLLNDPYYSGE